MPPLLSLLLLLLITLSSSRFHAHAVNTVNKQNPNFLLIVVDDLPVRGVAGFGDSVGASPNLDALIKQSIRFSNIHSTKSECAPSRTSMFTGRMPSETKQWDFDNVFRRRNPNLLTLPGMLRQNGYQTIALGKIMDERVYVPPGVVYITPDQCAPTDQANHCMWDYYARFVLALNTTTCSPHVGHYPGLSPSDYPRAGYYTPPGGPFFVAGGSDVDFIDYCLASHAIRYLSLFNATAARAALAPSSAPLPQPFFLAVGLGKPHLPYVAPARFFQKFEQFFTNARLQDYVRNTSYNSDAGFWNNECAGHHTLPPDDEAKSYSDYKSSTYWDRLQAFYACVSMMDEQVGRILDHLESLPLLRANAFVIVWGDHGLHQGNFDNIPWGKKTNFHGATRAPLVIRPPAWYLDDNPSIKANVGKATSAVASHVDVLPTVLEFAHIPTTRLVQANGPLPGTSLVPLMKDVNNGYVRAAAVSMYESYDKNFKDTLMGVSFITRYHRYTVWYHYTNEGGLHALEASNKPRRMLWDYSTDSTMVEKQNLVLDPSRSQGVKDAFAALLASLGGVTQSFASLVGKKPFDHDFPVPLALPAFSDWGYTSSPNYYVGSSRLLPSGKTCYTYRSEATCNSFKYCYWAPKNLKGAKKKKKAKKNTKGRCIQMMLN